MDANNDIIMHEANDSDSKLLLELYTGLYPEHRNKIKSFRIPKAKAITFIAEYREEPAGFVILTYISYGSPSTGFGYIEELFVRKRFRSLGIGKLLVKRVVSWCEKEGCNVIFLTTPKTNRGAIKFYRHLGFRKNGQIWLQYVMRKRERH
ncbi:MAG: GNAT family N-acetyltransferase [Candidatus Micrarchaeia archaeon]